MQLRDYFAFLRRRLWLLILGPVIASAVAIHISGKIAPEYRATAEIFVMNQSAAQINAANDLNSLTGGNNPPLGVNGLQVEEKLTNTYVRLIERRAIMEAVVATLALPMSAQDLEGKVSAEGIEDTQLILLKAEDADPARAAAIANTTAQQFVADMERLLGRGGSLSIAEEASLPSSPFKPNEMTNLMLAVVLGLLVAGAIAVSLDYLDDTIKSAADLDALGLVTLGAIPRFRRRSSRRDGDIWMAPVIEDFRELRTNIQFVDPESKVKTIVVTSFGDGEGKSTVASNLASVLAQAGERVVLVDADLRRPSLHQTLGARNSFGLSGLLVNDPGNWLSAVSSTAYPYMVFLPSGPIPPNPTELLTSKRMHELVLKLGLVTDFIVFDTPPVGSVADAAALAHSADGVLLVVEPGRTRTGHVSDSLKALQKVHAKVIGAVLNKQGRPRRRKGYATSALAPPAGRLEDLRSPLPEAVQRLQTLASRFGG